MDPTVARIAMEFIIVIALTIATVLTGLAVTDPSTRGWHRRHPTVSWPSDGPGGRPGTP